MGVKNVVNLAIRVCRNYTQNANKDLVCEHLKGAHNGVIVFGLNRPEQKNAMSMNLLQHLHNEVDKIPFDDNAKVLVIRSLVQGAFCAGTCSHLC